VTNITAKLRAKLAFDWSTMRKYAVDERSRNGRDADGFADGASAENARLSPLHAAMLAVIEAAKAHSCQMGEAALDETLAALERAL
jgi:hypothetical protein